MVSTMPTISPSATLASELRRAYRSLNRGIFDAKLPLINIEIQLQSKGCIKFIPEYNHITVGSGIVGKDGEYHTKDEILAELLHEMCHVYNCQRGAEDVTSNHYHNRKFTIVALTAGLYVLKRKTHGWSQTMLEAPDHDYDPDDLAVPSERALIKRVEVFDRTPLDTDVLRDAQDRASEVNKKVRANRGKVYFMKYKCNCPPPHNSIRSGRRPNGPHRLRVLCLDCKSPFVAEDDDGVLPMVSRQ